MRARIKEVGMCLFAAHGYRGVSMREIADAVGVSKAGLYYHFRDKESLFLAILTTELLQLESAIEQARQQGETAREQVRLLMRTLFAQGQTHQTMIRLASQEMRQVSPAARAEFGRLYHEKFIGQVETILRTGIDRGELKPLNPTLITWMLLGMAYPFLQTSQEGEQTADSTENLIEEMICVFFDGVAASKHG